MPRPNFTPETPRYMPFTTIPPPDTNSPRILHRHCGARNLCRLRLSLLELGLCDFRRLPIEDDFRLLEVAAGVLVDEDEGEVVAGGVFLVDFAESRGEVEAAEEEADGDGFAAGGRAVHDLLECEEG